MRMSSVLSRRDYEEPFLGDVCEGCGSIAGVHKPDSPECARYRKEQVHAAMARYRAEAERLKRARPGMVD